MTDDKFNKLRNLTDEQKNQLSKIQDLATRFQEGAPGENITGAEAAVTYKAVTSKLSSAQLEEATEETLGKLPENELQEVGNWIRQTGGEQFANVGNDPRSLANASLQLSSSQGSGVDGLLGSLLGGSGGSGGGSGMLDNPLVKSVLAGVASVAMTKFLGNSGSSGGGGIGGLISGLLGGGGSSSNNAAQAGGGLEDILGGFLGGGSGGSGGGLDDLLGGLLGGGSGGSGSSGGGLDDLLGGLLGGAQGGGDSNGGTTKAPTKKNVL